MDALIIIDMLNDFMHPQGALYVGEQVISLIHFCEKVIPQKRKEKSTIIYTCDTHWEDDEEFQLFPAHAVRGTWGHQVIEELTP
ncbi:MAG: isochorismatase family protein, partial [Candidatus Atribacteria bacterium]|nr:isochorismatase family protein [Candidatus Atribacteria bacterium]